ncbi:hypothetical protein ECGR_4439 [Escherichia coli]|nr:hypothetical protein ECGR_4439 [Escherichia coli]
MFKISIILPTYNVEQYIARAIESCINQTFKDIEIIAEADSGKDTGDRHTQGYYPQCAKAIHIIHYA